MACSSKSPSSLMDFLHRPDWEVGMLRLSRSLSRRKTRRRGIKASLCQDPLQPCTSPLLLEKELTDSLCRVVVCFIVEPGNTASASKLNGPETVRQWFVFVFCFFFLFIAVGNAN